MIVFLCIEVPRTEVGLNQDLLRSTPVETDVIPCRYGVWVGRCLVVPAEARQTQKSDQSESYRSGFRVFTSLPTPSSKNPSRLLGVFVFVPLLMIEEKILHRRFPDIRGVI